MNMKAITINEFGGREKLTLTEMPVPKPGKGDVLIRVKAAGVNPVDWKIRQGMLAKRLPHKFPLIPGWDAAGIVAETGPQTSLFLPGDEVYAYCRKRVVQHGAYAEFIVVPEKFVCLKPATLSFEQAASIPLVGLTAYQCLFEALDIQECETVLVHAAAGGVGGFVVQLASLHGVHVIATAQSVNHEYVLSLGARQAIDYTAHDFRLVVRQAFPNGIDAAIDAIGGETTFTTMQVLRHGGKMASIVRPKDRVVEEKIRPKNIHYEYVFVRPDAGQLAKLTELIDKNKLSTHVSTILPLEQAATAHALIETGHTRGKIVLFIK